jgi:hypothetical protein
MNEPHPCIHGHHWEEWEAVAFIDEKPVAYIRRCKECPHTQHINEHVDISMLP